MKTLFARCIFFITLFFICQHQLAQNVADTTVIPVVGDTIQQIPLQDTIVNQVKTDIREVPEQYIDFRVFKNIDVDSLKQQKKDLDLYMKNIDDMEKMIKSNYKELGNQYTIANNELKLISSDYKILSAKRKNIKTSEKLLNKEKKLRDSEIKKLKSERKAFDKISKDLSQSEIDARLQRFMDHDARIEKAKRDWFDKQENIKKEYKLLNDAEMKILRKESDIKNRISELNRYKQSLKLKQKQLDVEKKQVELEMKKAKLEMKVVGVK